jgi:hypothetical protein
MLPIVCGRTAPASVGTPREGINVVIHLASDAGQLLPVLRAGGRLVSTLIGTPDMLPAGTAVVVPVFANHRMHRDRAGCNVPGASRACRS